MPILTEQNLVFPHITKRPCIVQSIIILYSLNHMFFYSIINLSFHQSSLGTEKMLFHMKNVPFARRSKRKLGNYLNSNDGVIQKGKQIGVTKQRWNTNLFPHQFQLFTILNENLFHCVSAIICLETKLTSELPFRNIKIRNEFQQSENRRGEKKKGHSWISC